MPSAGPPPVTRPSVFLSYASEDRAAARALCETLSAAGLEVWFDESELGGGDAWDQKIRRQIRDCDYFMPVISATTERRKEGYFRREWRLAAERTLDMADDVLFLLPVVIDATSENGARVPEKFVTVQWLRAPGGERTAALDALVQRLVAGEHTIAPRPPLVTRPRTAQPESPPPPSEDRSHTPPPMPVFPHAPETGRVGPWLKFFAEVLWWGITAAWLLFTRLPRWVRIALAIWFVVTLLSTCGRDRAREPRASPSSSPTQRTVIDEKKFEAEATEAAKKIGEAIQHAIKEVTDRPAEKKSPEPPPPSEPK